ncbi:MAG: Nramp family divalent metal transporter, partial [Bacteroidales bacterium]|nr:Nramp family divalent metal transporter [Bacteroidales bacterium]
MSIRKFIRILGPGLLMAGAAVGVSHLVQSTRAGANYGFDLVWILILANAIKYPFFELGTRYSISTGNSLVEGYYKIGRWALIIFAALTLLTMFAIQAAVTIVTAGLFANLFNLTISPVVLSAFILIALTIIIMVGQYSILDKVIKWVIITLAISTLAAVVVGFNIGYHPDPAYAIGFNWAKNLDILFVIAFIGWMPAPIDLSVWQSVWTKAKIKDMKGEYQLRQSLLDLRIGYIGTALVALGFLTLGALVMHGSSMELSPQGVTFAEQLINLYTASLGEWAYPIIALAALTTMISTTLAVLDAYPRALKPTTELLVPSLAKIGNANGWLTWFWIIIVVIGTIALMAFFQKTMQFMVDLATTISFVTAPILAYLNYRA